MKARGQQAVTSEMELELELEWVLRTTAGSVDGWSLQLSKLDGWMSSPRPSRPTCVMQGLLAQRLSS